MGDSKGTVFLAGAAGAIGRRLSPLLLADGWTVIGTTRSAERAPLLRAMGVEPAIVDVFDEAALRARVQDAHPDVVIHQLSDLPYALDPVKMPEALVRNTRIREIGTHNLVAAAIAGGARRMIAQSIGFAYRPGARPYREDAPLDLDGPRLGVTARAVASLEHQVLGAPRSRELSCAMEDSMVPGQVSTRRRPRHRCTWMRRPMPQGARSTGAIQASTTWPRTTESCPATRPGKI